MARGEIFMRLPGSKEAHVWRTDLTGHGKVHVGEEFVCRECEFWGANRVAKGGKKLRVRVVAVRSKRIGNHDVIDVEILEDLSPATFKDNGLF